MNLDQLILGAYAYITLVVSAGLAGFLYLTSWLREIMTNHLHSVRKDIDEHARIDYEWFVRLEGEIEALKRR